MHCRHKKDQYNIGILYSKLGRQPCWVASPVSGYTTERPNSGSKSSTEIVISNSDLILLHYCTVISICMSGTDYSTGGSITGNFEILVLNREPRY